jgi:hypothetical protein
VQNSKEQQQMWWGSLSEGQKAARIYKWSKEKAEKRRRKSLNLMVKYRGKYKCSECFHGKLGCCTDRLPNGCEFWYSPTAKAEEQGVAFQPWK